MSALDGWFGEWFTAKGRGLYMADPWDDDDSDSDSDSFIDFEQLNGEDSDSLIEDDG